MSYEKRKFNSSLFIAAILVIILWIVKLVEFVFGLDFSNYGLLPLTWKGLLGIITSPLIHGDFGHLIANSSSFFILSFLLFYFYRDVAIKVLVLIWLITGLWVWVFARESYHIGASGVVYGLASFHFVSGIIRRNSRLLAVTLVVVFLYGSMVWGVFPEFFPKRSISWESHLMGLLSGMLIAIFFRKHGPQRKRYSWEFEEEDDDDDDENAYWNVPDTTWRQ